MTGKIYQPTAEQLARWDEEMKHWEDAVLVNKEYYDGIIAEMKEIEKKEHRKATIGDMLASMRHKGNLLYVMAYDYLDSQNPEVPFQYSLNGHDQMHLVLRAPHTPEQEQRLVFADAAFELIGGEGFWEHTQNTGTIYHDQDVSWYRDPQRPPLKPIARDKAIYYAAGLYMKQKIVWLSMDAPSNEDELVKDIQYYKKRGGCTS